MASRKEQKEQARARRLAEELATAERARRQRRLRAIGGAVLGAVAIVAVLVAVSSGGGGPAGLAKGQAATKTATAVQALLAGVPQAGPRLGRPTAPVTMTYYGDLQCPVCRDFTVNGGFPQLVSHEVRAGQVQVVYRAFQTATQDPAVFKAQQMAALAAGAQQKFWDFSELFYRQQGQEGSGYVTSAYLSGLAQQIPGLNLSKWQTSQNDAALTNQVTADGQAGLATGVNATPTLVFKGPKGQTSIASVASYPQLQQAIKKVL